MPAASVLILGCGTGGLVAANILATQTRRAATITVIERKTSFQFSPSFPWVMMGWRRPKQVQRDLTRLSKKRIKVINDNVKSIDVTKKRVRTDSSELSYDHLIVALGAEYTPKEIPGFQQYAHHSYDLEGAIKLQDALQTFPAGGNLLVGVSRLPFKNPSAPYEAAFLLEDHLRKTGKNVTLHFFTPEKHSVSAAGPVVGRQVERMLVARGIRFHPMKKLERIEKGAVVFEDGQEIAYDLLYAVPPHKCPELVVHSGLTDSSGWVPVNPQTLATKFDDVYAIGDVTAVETPHGHLPFLPKAGVFAQGQAETVANNLAVSITGQGNAKLWDGAGEWFLEVSRGEAAFLKGSFLPNPPKLEFHPPRRKWHLRKIAFEKYWMSHWF